MNTEEADNFVHAVARHWRSAPLTEQDKALCEYAAKLTHTPSEMISSDPDYLRIQGFEDRAIHDATQGISYFTSRLRNKRNPSSLNPALNHNAPPKPIEG